MFEAKDVLPHQTHGDLLSPAQAGIARNLQSYYQFHSAGPTPQRLQMLRDELKRRAEAKSADAQR